MKKFEDYESCKQMLNDLSAQLEAQGERLKYEIDHVDLALERITKLEAQLEALQAEMEILKKFMEESQKEIVELKTVVDQMMGAQAKYNTKASKILIGQKKEIEELKGKLDFINRVNDDFKTAQQSFLCKHEKDIYSCNPEPK